MTNKSGDKNFSRKGFLKLGWLKRQSTIESKNDLAPRANYIGVPIDKLNGLGIGNTFKINAHSDIYAVRIAEGIIFLSNLCPYDDAGITWKPNDRSEDAIGSPVAIASSKLIPKVSQVEGKTNMSALTNFSKFK